MCAVLPRCCILCQLSPHPTLSSYLWTPFVLLQDTWPPHVWKIGCPQIIIFHCAPDNGGRSHNGKFAINFMRCPDVPGFTPCPCGDVAASVDMMCKLHLNVQSVANQEFSQKHSGSPLNRKGWWAASLQCSVNISVTGNISSLHPQLLGFTIILWLSNC